MKIYTNIQNLFLKLIMLVCAIGALPWLVIAQNTNEITIIDSVLQQTDTGNVNLLLTIENSNRDVYPFTNHVRSDSVIDQIASTQQQSLADNNTQYIFPLRTELQTTDTFIVIVKNQDAIPVQVEPVFITIPNELQTTQNDKQLLQITRCSSDALKQNITCNYIQGDTSEETVNLTMYEKNVFGTIAQQSVITLSAEDTDTSNTDSFAIPVQQDNTLSDGTYPYEITDNTGRYLYQGSLQIGDIAITNDNETAILETTDTSNQASQSLTQMAIVVLALSLLALLVVYARKKGKLVIALILVLAVLIVGAYAVLSATFDSDDYPQYQYIYSLTPVSGDVYTFTYAAYDTYTASAPLVQQVTITYDGENYINLINSGTAQPSHVREITITTSQASTTAIKVVDGCASYYDATVFGTSRYGTRDCAPVPLFNTDITAVGCMDPLASNYDSNAVIASDSCQYLGCTIVDSVNYDPNANVNDGSCQACQWLPQLPDMTQRCTFESVNQTNNCSGETRTIFGTKQDRWSPDFVASDVCVGSSVTQTRQCSGVTPDPTRVVTGTGNDAFCFIPITQYEISTNLQNWTSCAAGDIKFSRSDQILYVRPTGSEPASSWTVNQADGEITGIAQRHQDDIWKINFSYPVERKTYNNVEITMNSPSLNTSTQTCTISLLNFEFTEQ